MGEVGPTHEFYVRERGYEASLSLALEISGSSGLASKANSTIFFASLSLPIEISNLATEYTREVLFPR